MKRGQGSCTCNIIAASLPAFKGLEGRENHEQYQRLFAKTSIRNTHPAPDQLFNTSSILASRGKPKSIAL